MIRVNTSLREAPSFNQTIFASAPMSRGALDYYQLTEEFLSRGQEKSLGRDPFEDPSEDPSPGSVEKLIRGAAPGREPGAKEVFVGVKLTPSNIKHLDAISAELARRGKPGLSRNDLIRIAITLLTANDV